MPSPAPQLRVAPNQEVSIIDRAKIQCIALNLTEFTHVREAAENALRNLLTSKECFGEEALTDSDSPESDTTVLDPGFEEIELGLMLDSIVDAEQELQPNLKTVTDIAGEGQFSEMVTFEAIARGSILADDLNLLRGLLFSENREKVINCLLSTLAQPEVTFEALSPSYKKKMILRTAQRTFDRFGGSEGVKSWLSSISKSQTMWLQGTTPQFQLFYKVLRGQVHPEWRVEVLQALGLPEDWA